MTSFYPRFEYDFPADPNESLENRTFAFEIGYHHRFDPGSNFLFLLSHSDASIDQKDFVSDPIIGIPGVESVEIFTRTKTDNPYYQAQAQYIVDAGKHQLISGTLHYWLDDKGHRFRDARLLDGNGDIAINDQGDPGQVISSTPIDSSSRFQSYYVQDIWNLSSNWTLEAALHFESLKNTSRSGSRDPKKTESQIRPDLDTNRTRYFSRRRVSLSSPQNRRKA